MEVNLLSATGKLTYPRIKAYNAYSHLESEGGLTKREYFAAMAMQGLLTSGIYAEGVAYNPIIGKLSVEIADELLKSL